MAPPNLLWVDVECSHIDRKIGLILEVAAVVTDCEMRPLDKGLQIVINYPGLTLDDARISDWARKQHSHSLWKDVENSRTTLAEAEEKIGDYMDMHRGNRRLMMAGSSVHFDLNYLREKMPSLQHRLHYRIVDVSSFLEMAKRWYPVAVSKLPPKPTTHRAMDDLKASIDLLNCLGKHMMKPRTPWPALPVTATSSQPFRFGKITNN